MNRGRELLNIILSIIGLVAIGLLISLLWMDRKDLILTNLVVGNFPAIIGLPFSFIASFIVFALFKQGSGPIEFGGYGLNFKGPAGEIILWIICFSTISGCIHMLWRD